MRSGERSRSNMKQQILRGLRALRRGGNYSGGGGTVGLECVVKGMLVEKVRVWGRLSEKKASAGLLNLQSCKIKQGGVPFEAKREGRSRGGGGGGGGGVGGGRREEGGGVASGGEGGGGGGGGVGGGGGGRGGAGGMGGGGGGGGGWGTGEGEGWNCGACGGDQLGGFVVQKRLLFAKI